MKLDAQVSRGLRAAAKHFWATRAEQARKQGLRTGSKDTGARAAVTGGRQMDGFVRLVRELLCTSGLETAQIFTEGRLELPGWYRPEKQWDLLIVLDGRFVAAMEFKSQVGSFGNNFNNRTEEALGSAVDLWAAYREGAFRPLARPWLGYLMLLEEAPASLKIVGNREPHFPVFPEFHKASYCKRYEILLTKLVRERLYHSACLLLSNASQGPQGRYREPVAELTFRNFAASLLGRLNAEGALRRD